MAQSDRVIELNNPGKPQNAHHRRQPCLCGRFRNTILAVLLYRESISIFIIRRGRYFYRLTGYAGSVGFDLSMSGFPREA